MNNEKLATAPQQILKEQSSCHGFACNRFEEKLLLKIDEFLSVQANVWNTTMLFEYLQNLKLHDKHNHLGDIKLVLHSLDSCSTEIQNLFDNYVCFYGTENLKRFETLCRHICQRTQNISLEHCVHPCFVLKIIQACTNSINHVFADHNAKIIQIEVELTDKVKFDLISAYRNQLHIYANQTVSHSLEKVQQRMQNHLITCITNCLESDGRLCHVQKSFNRNMLEETDAIYKQVRHPNNQVLNLIINGYKTKMGDVLKSPHNYTTKAILDFHTQSVRIICDKLQSKNEIDAAETVLNRHLMHVLEHRFELKYNENIPPNISCTPLCIHLTTEYIHVAKVTKTGRFVFVYKNENENDAPAFVCLEDDENKAKFRYGFAAKNIVQKQAKKILSQGSVEHYLNMRGPDSSHAAWMLTELFKKILLDAEKTFEEESHSLLLLIPTWYNIEFRTKLQNFAKAGGFLQVVLLSDSAVIASQIFFEHANTDQKLVIPITISPSDILVEIYESDSEIGRTKLLALSRVRFNSASGQTNSNVNALQLACLKALSQLNEESKEKENIYFVQTIDVKWQAEFENFLQSEKTAHILKAKIGWYASRGVTRLANNINEIRNYMFDIVHVNIESSDNSQSSVQSIQTGVSNTHTNKAEKEQAANQLLKRKQLLLQRIRIMREQLENGKVRIRGVLLKAFNKTLTNAENTALNHTSGLDEVLADEAEVMDLITEHDFEISS